MNIQNLPLSQLVPSPANVRKTDRSNGIEQLAASIKAHGLLQNVQVKEAANGQFEVVAGGRRLAALRLLAKHKEIEADHPVPCNVLNGEDVTEISLAENEIRHAMHPADQFEAFKALADGGMSEDDIAARFGVPPLVVRQRLKLANVSAKIIAAYRKGELDLECVMAFAVTDDHKAQERVWKVWRSYPEYQREAENIRAMLTEQHIDADSKLALFVTVKAYEKAGGSVIRDLFEADSEGWLTDAELLNRLAKEKLAAVQAKLIEGGWKWADIMPDIDYSALHRFERLRASRNDDDDKDGFTAKQKAKSGCIVAVGHGGKLDVHAGLLRPEDAKAERKAAAKNRGKDGEPKGKDPNALSASLIESLTAHQTAALAAKLAHNPKVALVAVVHALAIDALFDPSPFTPALKISGTVTYFGAAADETDKAASAKEQADATSAATKGMPKNPEKLWDWLLGKDQKELLALLAVCAAACVDTIQKRGTDDSIAVRTAELAEALKLDMADYWQPTAAGYFSRVSKEQTLAAIGQACGAGAKAGFVTLKKAALAEAAEKKLKGSRWLPELLRAA
jgi:ParB family transcriptional regulator, chromosome partitioning protein